jgi:hypothetical protein
MATLRPAIADGYRAFDFLRGDEPYKAHWRAQPRPGLEVRVFSRRGGAWLRQRARSAGRQVRDWLRGLAATSDQQPPTSTRPLVMPLAPTAGHDAAASAFNIPTSSPRA